MKHAVRTFKLSGELIYEANHETAEKAYAEYADIVENAQRTLPKGYGVHIARYADGKAMTIETVIGTH